MARTIIAVLLFPILIFTFAEADNPNPSVLLLDFSQKQPYISVKQYPVNENIDSDTTVEAFIEEYRSALK